MTIEHTIVRDDTNTGDTLLFLHGLGGDHTNWKPQLDAFGQQHRCISWTMPGYGASTPLDPMTWPTLADAAVSLLDDYGVARASLIGLSMGGMVAQQFAVDHADRLDRLVLVATSPSFGRPGSDFKEKYLAARYEPLDRGETPADLAPKVVEGLLGPDPHPDARANCIASMSNITTDAYRRALECLVTWAFDDQLHRITAPTMCIAGEEDRTAPVSSVQRMADGIAGARLDVIAAAGHLVNLDKPDEFNSLLTDFLAS